MCKLAFAKTIDGRAYQTVVNMIIHQQEVVAGHSTGIAWFDTQKGNVHLRKVVGKMNSFLAEFPDIPKSNMALGHSRFASVGAINKENQHPITLHYNNKIIGYGIHNGHWGGYYKYEYLRKARQENQTDSAVMFAIYEKILEQLGTDSHENRIIAMATLQKFVGGQYGDGKAQQNLIFMFKDRQVIFSGHTLTYKIEKNFIGVMTFGYNTAVEDNKIYEIKGYNITKMPLVPIEFTLEPQERKKETYIKKDWHEEIQSRNLQSSPPEQELIKNNNNKIIDKRKFDGDTFYYIETYLNENIAKNAAERIKTSHKTMGFEFYYRIIAQTLEEANGNNIKYKLYGRKEKISYTDADVKKWWSW
jgi:predicted glutamine amidotransferase